MSYPKNIAIQHKIKPTKKLGQNFLEDQSIIYEIVTMSAIKGHTVLEIGPGTGNLTRAILEHGAIKVFAVEFDQQCIETLESLKLQYKNLEIIQADALDFQEETLGNNIKIVANLPYNIGTALLLKWLQKIQLFSSITIMLQKEVVDRIVAKPCTKNYGSLSVICQVLCDAEKLFDVPNKAFWPIPKVTSSVVRLIPNQKQNCDLGKLEAVLKAAFVHRRKTLFNNLKHLIPDQLSQLFTNIGVLPKTRAEELTIEQFCLLAKAI
jgi:16S rRNA (adenine1518-N6/adenine1519-N6)-dimethyltransferase